MEGRLTRLLRCALSTYGHGMALSREWEMVYIVVDTGHLRRLYSARIGCDGIRIAAWVKDEGTTVRQWHCRFHTHTKNHRSHNFTHRHTSQNHILIKNPFTPL